MRQSYKKWWESLRLVFQYVHPHAYIDEQIIKYSQGTLLQRKEERNYYILLYTYTFKATNILIFNKDRKGKHKKWKEEHITKACHKSQK